MAAKDYTFGAGWKNIYLTKKTKPRKDGLHIMSNDRRRPDTAQPHRAVRQREERGSRSDVTDEHRPGIVRYVGTNEGGKAMTQEQYHRAVKISERLEELGQVKKEIEETVKHRLWYAWKCESDWRLTSEWTMRYISELLDKHDLMIRQEIDEEIEQLKAEIETL